MLVRVYLIWPCFFLQSRPIESSSPRTCVGLSCEWPLCKHQKSPTMSPGWILLRWRETGEVKWRKDHHAYGRPRHLKLQEILRDSCEVDASAQAICRALKRSGFSMKKVSSSIFINRILNPPLNMVHTGSLLKHPLNEALSNQTCGVHGKDWLELTGCIFGWECLQSEDILSRSCAWTIRGRQALWKHFSFVVAGEPLSNILCLLERTVKLTVMIYTRILPTLARPPPTDPPSPFDYKGRVLLYKNYIHTLYYVHSMPHYNPRPPH